MGLFVGTARLNTCHSLTDQLGSAESPIGVDQNSCQLSLQTHKCTDTHLRVLLQVNEVKLYKLFIFIISQQSGSVSFMRGSCHQKLIPPTSRTFCISLCCCCVQTLSCAFLKVKWKFGIHLFCCFYNPLLTINEFSGSERMTASLEQRGYKIWHNVGMVQIDFTQASLSNHLQLCPLTTVEQ